MKSPSRLRVSAGALRGRRLRVPAGARPSSALLREALFSIWGERVRGAAVLDLFAGSGAVGIEALSRGAERAVFVERERAALSALAGNLELVEPRSARVVRGGVIEALTDSSLAGETFDLLFADPPYAVELGSEFYSALRSFARPGAWLAVERRAEPARVGLRTSGWRLADSRRYGDSTLSLFELAGDD